MCVSICEFKLFGSHTNFSNQIDCVQFDTFDALYVCVLTRYRLAVGTDVSCFGITEYEPS